MFGPWPTLATWLPCTLFHLGTVHRGLCMASDTPLTTTAARLASSSMVCPDSKKEKEIPHTALCTCNASVPRPSQQGGRFNLCTGMPAVGPCFCDPLLYGRWDRSVVGSRGYRVCEIEPQIRWTRRW
ncbi:hypothetical protein BCV70DRAFT_200621 [Testicularia cyperi]|uniref:Secreted protein n=1 Tax=Testicularia cyperi TaxID=1882483 RepID=A0A317XN11_9BASI|nr:hypothetical protein BCV70DRAFT_200621 [Testicularia cyperi]